MLMRISLRSLRRLSAIAPLTFLALSLMPSALLRAQTYDATMLRRPTELSMTWVVKQGDDPAYARSDFDDSKWTVVDPNRSLKEYFPNARPEVLWYRLHVKVAPNETGLALEEYNLSNAFEIYLNGERMFETGSVSPYHPYTFNARIVKRIPDSVIATGSLVIAMRVHDSASDWISSFPGFYPTNLIIGQEVALSDHVWLNTIGEHALGWFYQIAGLGLGIIAFASFTAQRRQREYLWIFLLFLVVALGAPLGFYLLFHNLPAWIAFVSQGFGFAGVVLTTLMYFAFLRLRLARWVQIIFVLAALGVSGTDPYWHLVGTAPRIGNLVSYAPEIGLAAAIIPILLIVHWRRGNHEAGHPPHPRHRIQPDDLPGSGVLYHQPDSRFREHHTPLPERDLQLDCRAVHRQCRQHRRVPLRSLAGGYSRPSLHAHEPPTGHHRKRTGRGARGAADHSA